MTTTVPGDLTSTTHPDELGWDPEAAARLDWEVVTRNALEYVGEIPPAGRLPDGWETLGAETCPCCREDAP